MIAAVSNMFRGYNWYDAVVPIVLAYGVWNGWEAPFTEKIFGVAEMMLALVVGIEWYGPVSARSGIGHRHVRRRRPPDRVYRHCHSGSAAVVTRPTSRPA